MRCWATLGVLLACRRIRSISISSSSIRWWGRGMIIVVGMVLVLGGMVMGVVGWMRLRSRCRVLWSS